MEPWIDELQRYTEAGGSLQDLGKRFRDAGIRVESAIDFFEWAVDDEARRKKGLEAARKSMEMLQKIGGKRLAAPPVGATETEVDPVRLAERYRALLELGDTMGVVPQVEVWGSSRTLGRLGEAAMVAIESGHPRACILPDVFHLYKGGSSLGGYQAACPRRHSRLPRQRLSRRSPTPQAHRRRPYFARRRHRPVQDAASRPASGRVSGDALARAFQPATVEAGP